MSLEPLFLNHLAFMASHRGAVRLSRRDYFVEGTAPGFTTFVPGMPETEIPEGCAAVRLAPWSGQSWATRLEAGGFQRAEALAYMELADPFKDLVVNASTKVTVVSDVAGADNFAAIQSGGFATGDPEVDEWWASYFVEQARANYIDPAQRFYLGWDEGRPVTSTLVVRAHGVSGIYAVATLPAQRKRGLSAAVLDRARIDALAHGHSRVILQAMVESYAALYYAKLGFVTRYVSQVWRRPSS